MPFYIADYLADTLRLTYAQHGVYMLLIMDYWRNGPPPDDPRILRTITKTNEEQWEEDGVPVMAFFERKDGKLMHGRIEKELEHSTKVYSASVARANAANLARKNKQIATSAEQTINEPSTLAERTLSEHSANVQRLHEDSTNVERTFRLPQPQPQPQEEQRARRVKAPGSSDDEVSFGSKNEPNSPGSLFGFPEISAKFFHHQMVRDVWDHYLAKTGRDEKIYGLTPLRLKKGLARLAEALIKSNGNTTGAVNLMKLVVDEMCASTWHVERGCFDWDIHLFHSREKFEDWINRYEDRRKKDA